MPSMSDESGGRAAGTPVRLDPQRLVPAVIAAALTVAAASPWGEVAMVAGGLGALAAGLAVALREVARTDAGRRPVPAAPSSLLVDGETDLGRALAAQPAHTGAPLVFIDHPTDTATAQALDRILKQGADRRVAAHIRDAALRRALRQRFEVAGPEPRPVLIGVAAIVARSVVARERLYDQAYWRDQPRLHAVVIGFGAMGRACLAEAIFAGIAGQLAPPRITILDPDPDRVRRLLAQEMPELGLSADIDIQAYDTAAPLEADGAPLRMADQTSPLTAIFVCLDDETAQVAALLGLSRPPQTPAPVFVLSEQRSALVALACPADTRRRFVVADGPAVRADILAAVLAQTDAAAERLHEAYRSRFGGQGASGVPWDELPESYREANRRATRHLPQKLWTAGLTAPGLSADQGRVAPEAYSTIVEPCSRTTGEDALMRRLARLEHDSWCADRRLDGWSYAATRDDHRRHHPDLVSFDDPRFSDGEIAKDIDQIRVLFGAVAEPGPDGVSAPLVLGIVPAAPEVNGIDVPGALALSAHEGWRPVTIVSALTDAGAVATVSALAGALRSAGRAVRLIVPEASGPDPAHQGETRPPPGLAALLADPCTSIVPIAARPAPDDGWADAQAAADDPQRLARYIARRATALVLSA